MKIESVFAKLVTLSVYLMLCIVADTGIGCNLEEFQNLRCPREFNGAKIWGQLHY